MKYIKTSESFGFDIIGRHRNEQMEYVIPQDIIDHLMNQFKSDVSKDYSVTGNRDVKVDGPFIQNTHLDNSDDRYQFIIDNNKDEENRITIYMVIYVKKHANPHVQPISIRFYRSFHNILNNEFLIQPYYNLAYGKWSAFRSSLDGTNQAAEYSIFWYLENTIRQCEIDLNTYLEEKKFFKKHSKEEITDLLGDLSDIIGPFTLNKNGGKVFSAVFRDVPKSIKISGGGDIYIDPSDELIQFMTEINSLKKRLKNGYNLDMLVNVYGNWGDDDEYDDDNDYDENGGYIGGNNENRDNITINVQIYQTGLN